MTPRSKCRTAAVGIAIALLGALAAYRVYVITSDDFSEKLAELAGPNAQSLGVYTGHSYELEDKMANSFGAKQPFWARSNREYINVHNTSEAWNVSEGFVLTSGGDLFRIDRRPATFFSNAKLSAIKFDGAEVRTHDDGSRFLVFGDASRVALPW